jgi:hypothetical protein
MSSQNCQLVGILFTGIVGCAAMIKQNEPNAVMAVKRYVTVLQKTFLDHLEKILNDYGDGSIKRGLNASPYLIALDYVVLGEVRTAINWFNEGYRFRDLHMFFINVDPEFDSIRNDPRFIKLLKKMSFHD